MRKYTSMVYVENGEGVASGSGHTQGLIEGAWGGYTPSLFSQRGTANEEREHCQDEIASDVSRMRNYVCMYMCFGGRV